jgi:hypothetical protein
MMHISTVMLKCGCHIIMLQQHNPDQPIKSIEMLKVVDKIYSICGPLGFLNM